MTVWNKPNKNPHETNPRETKSSPRVQPEDDIIPAPKGGHGKKRRAGRNVLPPQKNPPVSRDKSSRQREGETRTRERNGGPGSIAE